MKETLKSGHCILRKIGFLLNLLNAKFQTPPPPPHTFIISAEKKCHVTENRFMKINVPVRELMSRSTMCPTVCFV